jgi:hypothetical protein
VCLSMPLVCPCAVPQLYVYHFCGHYVFLPMFFNKALCNLCFPKRWRLPAKALEEVSTSVRVIARLLWTVHLDFSQEVGAFGLLTRGGCIWSVHLDFSQEVGALGQCIWTSHKRWAHLDSAFGLLTRGGRIWTVHLDLSQKLGRP